MLRVFGPVPSRRLGRSLGVNNIPAKKCSYSCVYCQLGAGYGLEIERRSFFDPQETVDEVTKMVHAAEENDERIDYLTFVPDGEPTLDANLGMTIELLRPLGVKTAVITNSSLMWRSDVRHDLSQADLVSVKVDTTDEHTWHRVNRPYRDLRLDRILEGIREFASSFRGSVITETMLVAGVNDGEESIGAVADYLIDVNPSDAYIAVPTRPPAEKWVEPPSETSLNRAYQVMSSRLKNVEYLIGYEGDAFAHTGSVAGDILSITSVHPMRRSAMDEFLSKAGESWDIPSELIRTGRLLEVEYRSDKYYLRNLRK